MSKERRMDFIAGKKIAAFFKSRRLAVVLIFLIIIFSIMGTHIPQKSQLKPEVYDRWKTSHPIESAIFEKIGFTSLFSSFAFVSLAALLFLNTLFCTGTMLGSAIRRLKDTPKFQRKEYISGLENSTVIRTEEENENIVSEINDVLRSHGYKAVQEDNRIFAEKNRFGILGTSMFHISILLIILAAVYGSTGRMEGDMKLIEGQTLSEEHGNYMFINEGPFFNERHQKFNITLEKFYPDYRDETGTPRGPAGELAIMENGKKVKTDITYANHLVTYKGYTFLGNVYGLAPLLILVNPDGTVASGSYITASDTDNSGRYVTYFEMGGTGLEGGLMVYMTAPLTEINSGDVKQTPIMFLKVFDKGKEIFDGTLRLNETVQIHDKYLVFYDIKYWSNFYVVKDSGTPLVYAGIGLITLSLIMIFFVIPRRVWVEIVEEGNTNIYMGGRADKFRSLYGEEYSGIVNEIEERLSNGTG